MSARVFDGGFLVDLLKGLRYRPEEISLAAIRRRYRQYSAMIERRDRASLEGFPSTERSVDFKGAFNHAFDVYFVYLRLYYELS